MAIIKILNRPDKFKTYDDIKRLIKYMLRSDKIDNYNFFDCYEGDIENNMIFVQEKYGKINGTKVIHFVL